MNARFETLKTKRTKLFLRRVNEHSIPFNMEDWTIKGLCLTEFGTEKADTVEDKREFQIPRQTTVMAAKGSPKRGCVFIETSARLLQLAQFVKCRRALLELNSYEKYPSLKYGKIFVPVFNVGVLHKTWNSVISCHVRAGVNIPKRRCACRVMVFLFRPSRSWVPNMSAGIRLRLARQANTRVLYFHFCTFYTSILVRSLLLKEAHRRFSSCSIFANLPRCWLSRLTVVT